MSSSSLFISAGDPSGDIATARLVQALKELKPGLSSFGLGGERLKALGQEQLANGDDLAVLGFWEVVKRYSYFRELMHRTIDEITQRRPACILLVDYPGFNLRLAKRIKHLGIPIVYYISPQLWAWGGKRISQVRELVDLLILILPFEKEFYASSGVKSEFVGHYLLEDIPSSLISSPIPKSRQLALLPGSRPQEIERMLETMCNAAATFCARHEFRAVIAGVKNGAKYRLPSGLESAERDLVRVTKAEFPEDLRAAFGFPSMGGVETILLKKNAELAGKNAAFTILYVKAMLRLRDIIRENPDEFKLFPETADLLTDKRIREALNPIMKEIADKGAISGLPAGDQEQYEWAVSELYNIFYQLAERKAPKALDINRNSILFNKNATENMNKAA